MSTIENETLKLKLIETQMQLIETQRALLQYQHRDVAASIAALTTEPAMAPAPQA